MAFSTMCSIAPIAVCVRQQPATTSRSAESVNNNDTFVSGSRGGVRGLKQRPNLRVRSPSPNPHVATPLGGGVNARVRFRLRHAKTISDIILFAIPEKYSVAPLEHRLGPRGRRGRAPFFRLTFFSRFFPGNWTGFLVFGLDWHLRILLSSARPP